MTVIAHVAPSAVPETMASMTMMAVVAAMMTMMIGVAAVIVTMTMTALPVASAENSVVILPETLTVILVAIREIAMMTMMTMMAVVPVTETTMTIHQPALAPVSVALSLVVIRPSRT